MCLEWLKKLVNGDNPPPLQPNPNPNVNPDPKPQLTVYEERDWDWIKSVLIENKVLSDANHEDGLTQAIQLDNQYWVTDMNNVLNVISYNWVDKKTYIPEKHDCDNFAIMFYATAVEDFQLNSIGIVIDWSSGHAYNLIVLSNRQVLLLEPQSDTYFFPPYRDVQYYGLKDGLVLI
jgi:hypothetical protein